MKKGKIILSAASLVVTVAGIFAFKSAKQFTSGHTCYTFLQSRNPQYQPISNCFTLNGTGTQVHNQCLPGVQKYVTNGDLFTSVGTSACTIAD